MLQYFDHENIKLCDFLDAISWGDPLCTNDPKVRAERTGLLQDQRLGDILQRWAQPPRQPGSKKRRPQGAAASMTKFAITWTRKSISDELEYLAPTLLSP